MKFSLVFSLLLTLSGCIVKEDSKGVSQSLQTQEDSTETSSFRSHSMTYQEARVQIETDQKKIHIMSGFDPVTSKTIRADGTVTHVSACGLKLESGSTISYEILDDSLGLHVDGRFLIFHRIHDSQDDKDVFGDWAYTEIGKKQIMRITFYIEDHDILNADLDCTYF